MSFFSSGQPIVIPEPNAGGVQTITAGSNVVLTGTAINPIINATEQAGGVATVTAGSNIVLTGTATNPIINAGPPSGTMMLNAAVNPPTGWLNCDGSSYANATYPDLFAAIGYRYSAGFGGPTFSQTDDFYTINASNTITIPITRSTGVPTYNHQIIVGSQVELNGYVAATGPNVNGLIITIVSCPPIGDVGSSTPYVGTFNVPQSAGTGGLSGTEPSLTIVSFQVPLTNGKTIRGTDGVDADYTLGVVGGADTVVLTPANLPSHAHNTPGHVNQGIIGYDTGDLGYGGSGNLEDHTPVLTTGAEVLESDLTTVATASGAAGTAVNIRNSYIAITYIIKT
jgi:microcystin-dependent protein